jgi:hypothetical protein
MHLLHQPFSLRRRAPSRGVWLAIVALVLAACMPTISRLIASQADVAWLEVCTARGIERVALDSNEPSRAATVTVADDVHCGYCVLQAHSPLLDSACPTRGPMTLAANRLGTGPGGSTVPLHEPREANSPRAPPLTS